MRLMNNQVKEIKAEIRKLELECQKLALEIKQMKKIWWKKTSSWAIIVTVLSALITGGVSLVNHFLSLKKDERERRGEYINIVKTVGTSQEFLTEQEKSANEDAEKRKNLLLESVKK